MNNRYQSAVDAINNIECRTGEKFELEPCPHCGHGASLCDPLKDPDMWGGYIWQIVCSSSHCRARVQIVADGWFEQYNAPNPSYRDRVTDLRFKWNRRVRAAA